MKRVMEVDGMCCKRCAKGVEKDLLLLDGVTGASADFARGLIFVETTLPDEALITCVEEAGFEVKKVRSRRGIFC